MIMIEAIINNKAVAADGTSLSAPVFAGMVSLVNAYLLQQGGSTLGWLNPSIYSNNGGYANDVTSGNNSCTKTTGACCSSIGFQGMI